MLWYPVILYFALYENRRLPLVYCNGENSGFHHNRSIVRWDTVCLRVCCARGVGVGDSIAHTFFSTGQLSRM